MLRYAPGDSVVHGLDPRSKLAFQFGFAIAAFASTAPAWIGGLTLFALIIVRVSQLSIQRALLAYWPILIIITILPFIAGLTLGDPWFRPATALGSALGFARLVPVLLISAAFVHTTPIRDTRAAIQRTIPGKFGQLLGVGVALTFRNVSLVREDVERTRDAIAVRAGDQRSVRDRASRLVLLSLSRIFDRVDRLSLALRARCFAWNPTLPRLRFAWLDYLVVAASGLLAVTPFLWLIL